MSRLDASQRRASQTLPGGRFPMPDREHARLALQMLPKAKHLSPEQRAEVRKRAMAMLGKGKA